MKPITLLLFVGIIILFSGCFPGNSSAMKQGFVTISEMELKQLVMHIEFYKLQNGHYPDRLEQLQETDKLAPITDPAQGMQAKAPSVYNYERMGEKYTLFSSGMDGVAGTKDDFYPQVDIPDSSKIGLIKKPR
jgi:Type II secretion system (T2SS), protein G